MGRRLVQDGDSGHSQDPDGEANKDNIFTFRVVDPVHIKTFSNYTILPPDNAYLETGQFNAIRHVSLKVTEPMPGRPSI